MVGKLLGASFSRNDQSFGFLYASFLLPSAYLLAAKWSTPTALLSLLPLTPKLCEVCFPLTHKYHAETTFLEDHNSFQCLDHMALSETSISLVSWQQ